MRTDGRDEANSRFSQFFESFQKYGMSSWTEFGWFRTRTEAISFKHGIDPWGSLRDGSFLSGFWQYSELVLKPVQESIQTVCRNFH